MTAQPVENARDNMFIFMFWNVKLILKFNLCCSWCRCWRAAREISLRWRALCGGQSATGKASFPLPTFKFKFIYWNENVQMSKSLVQVFLQSYSVISLYTWLGHWYRGQCRRHRHSGIRRWKRSKATHRYVFGALRKTDAYEFLLCLSLFKNGRVVAGIKSLGLNTPITRAWSSLTQNTGISDF